MEDLLGPLSVLYSWQSLLLAFGVAALTHVVKAVIDLKLGGKEERQRRLWANRVVLPLTPIALGALGGAVVPLHPEALIEYLTDHAIEGWKYYLSLAAYGGAVGQFSDYVWHRYSGLRDDVKKRRKASPSPSERSPDDTSDASAAPPDGTPVPPEPSSPSNTEPSVPTPEPSSNSPVSSKPLKLPVGFTPALVSKENSPAPVTPSNSTPSSELPVSNSTPSSELPVSNSATSSKEPSSEPSSAASTRRRRSAFKR